MSQSAFTVGTEAGSASGSSPTQPSAPSLSGFSPAEKAPAAMAGSSSAAMQKSTAAQILRRIQTHLPIFVTFFRDLTVYKARSPVV